MKKGIIHSLFIGLLALASCSPRVTSTLIKAKAPLEEGEELTVLQPEDPELANAMVIETIRATGPEYEPLVEMSVEKAREAGANVLKIVDTIAPDIASPKHRVASIAYWADDSIQSDSVKIAPNILEDGLDLKKVSGSWRFAIQGGGAYRLGKMDTNQDAVTTQHLKNLRFGYTYGADVTRFFSENFGLGLKFNNHHTGDSMPVAITDSSTGKTTDGVLEDQIDIWFLGPVFTYRLLSRNRNNAFIARAGIGYEGFFDNGMVGKEKGTIKGGTFGLLYELGYDFGISKHLSVGASLTLIMGALNSIDVTVNGKTANYNLGDQREGISNVGLSIGLRYNL